MMFYSAYFLLMNFFPTISAFKPALKFVNNNGWPVKFGQLKHPQLQQLD